MVDDELQVVLALGLAPAGKVIAGLGFAGARAKSEQDAGLLLQLDHEILLFA